MQQHLDGELKRLQTNRGRIYSLFGFQADSAARLQSKKTFQGTVQAMDINTDSLNGLDFNREVVTLDGGGVIYGR